MQHRLSTSWLWVAHAKSCQAQALLFPQVHGRRLRQHEPEPTMAAVSKHLQDTGQPPGASYTCTNTRLMCCAQVLAINSTRRHQRCWSTTSLCAATSLLQLLSALGGAHRHGICGVCSRYRCRSSPTRLAVCGTANFLMSGILHRDLYQASREVDVRFQDCHEWIGWRCTWPTCR